MFQLTDELVRDYRLAFQVASLSRTEFNRVLIDCQFVRPV